MRVRVSPIAPFYHPWVGTYGGLKMKREHGHHHDDDEDCVPCFVEGSVVITRLGTKYVEDIVPGDLILTRDNGYKEVAWAGMNASCGYIQLENTRVSPNHRMLVKVPDEKLIPAKFIAGRQFVDKAVNFVHFLFDQHELVMVDGLWSESFYPGYWIMNHMKTDQSEEIRSLFPRLDFTLARNVMSRKFAERSQINAMQF
jgi:hypothetical protein